MEKNGENKKERYNKRNLRSGYFSGLEKIGKEYVDIGVEDFSKGNKFRYLDVHTVGFQLGISALDIEIYTGDSFLVCVSMAD